MNEAVKSARPLLASLLLFHLLFLFLLLSTTALGSDDHWRFDVCASTEEEERMTWKDFHKGVFIDISTGGSLLLFAGESYPEGCCTRFGFFERLYGQFTATTLGSFTSACLYFDSKFWCVRVSLCCLVLSYCLPSHLS